MFPCSCGPGLSEKVSRRAILDRSLHYQPGAGAGAGQGEEVRLVPYFDGVGPRTSAAGSLDPQQQGDSHVLLPSCPRQDAEHC